MGTWGFNYGDVNYINIDDGVTKNIINFLWN